MSAFTLRKFFPRSLHKPLWGDRSRWGHLINQEDHCWKEWQKTYSNFYAANQRAGIGKMVNNAGYRIMAQIDMTGKRVLEIGAGDIGHIIYWHGSPDEYILVDVNAEMMAKAEQRLVEKGCPHRSILLERMQTLPLADASVDVVVSFYSLEHLYPLAPYLHEMNRVLVPGGILIGAIPTEGSLAWGVGRMLTSRRWLHKNTNIDPDKIICWEHPNFADQIITECDGIFNRSKLNYWPMAIPIIDINLIMQFIYNKGLTRV
ncbi:MAG: class I SAM-dependent methyltransferase [Magnetococcales bacterium]|nr:class I SAM-dependent methyltransferase [Magnetococcales bacterium]